MRYRVTGFEQLDKNQYTIGGFSLLVLDDLPDNELYYGRLPETSDEIVVEKWVLEKALNKSTLGNFMNVKSFLNETIKIGAFNFDFKIVGIADNDEHAIYINKWRVFDVVMNWCSYQNVSIGSLEDIYET